MSSGISWPSLPARFIPIKVRPQSVIGDASVVRRQRDETLSDEVLEEGLSGLLYEGETPFYTPAGLQLRESIKGLTPGSRVKVSGVL